MVVRMVLESKARLSLRLLIAVGVLVSAAVLGVGRARREQGRSALMHVAKHWRISPRSVDLPRSDLVSLPSAPRAFAARMPARVVWAWEEPEDLQSLPPTVGVAYLAETLMLSNRLRVVPRRQPLHVAAKAPVMAVARLEAVSGFADSPQLREEAARQLAQVALRPGVRALQIDFDAAASQLPFYRAVLQALRLAMPDGEPLSITALASWCGEQSWLQGLPLDEAVPMLFRMGGPREMRTATHGRYPLRARLCRGSRGISVDEPWPQVLRTMDPEARVYLFAPRPWQQWELKAAAATPLPELSEALERVPSTAASKQGSAR